MDTGWELLAGSCQVYCEHLTEPENIPSAQNLERGLFLTPRSTSDRKGKSTQSFTGSQLGRSTADQLPRLGISFVRTALKEGRSRLPVEAKFGAGEGEFGGGPRRSVWSPVWTDWKRLQTAQRLKLSWGAWEDSPPARRGLGARLFSLLAPRSW
ncbi:hypothetical protein AOLI_G00005200 [Acnodon oligacanthus]